MEKTLYLPQETIDKYNKLMQVANGTLAYTEHQIPRYATIAKWTVDFGNGYEVDIKVCSSDDGDPLWCEGVLFLHGSELSCTDPSDNLNDQCWFWVKDETFIVYVKPEQTDK